MATLESRLFISATDDTGAAFASVKERIKALEKSALEVERVFESLGRVMTETNFAEGEGMNIAIANMERMIALTEKAAAAQRTLAKSATAVGGALAREGRAGSAGAARLGAAGGVAPRAAAKGETFIGGAKGMLPVMAAIGIYEVGKRAVENAGELEQQRMRIRELSRNDPSEAPLADSLANEVAGKYPSITRAKALETYTEMRANSVDANGRVDSAVARRNLMAASRAQNAALALGFEMTPVDMQNLLKGVEGSGRASDPKAVEKITDAYIRAKQVFGSAIASQMVRDYTANAKSANFSIGDDQFYLSNMVRMSEGNASRLGNEVNQTLATMVGGHMTKATGDWMVAHGLARRDQIVKTGPGTVSIKGGLKDADLLQTDQGRWAATTLRKSIEDSGALSDDKVDARAAMLRAQELKRNPSAEIDERFLRERAEEGLLSAEIAKTGMRSSVTDNLAHFIGNQRLIERDIAALMNSSGAEAGDRIAQNPIAALKEFTESLTNLGGVLAGPGVAASGPILHAMAEGIAALSSSLAAFTPPDWMKEFFTKKIGRQGPPDERPGGHGFKDIHFGPPIWEKWTNPDQYTVDRANWNAAYWEDESGSEFAREHRRAIAFSGGAAGGASSPQEVNVHGEAEVRSVVTVTASSELLRVIAQAEAVTTQMALNPVAMGHTGRMDSDAAPIPRGMPGRR